MPRKLIGFLAAFCVTGCVGPGVIPGPLPDGGGGTGGAGGTGGRGGRAGGVAGGVAGGAAAGGAGGAACLTDAGDDARTICRPATGPADAVELSCSGDSSCPPDGQTGWTNLTPAVLPAAWPSGRESAGMAYDPRRRRVVLFGGQAGAPQNDLWEWDPATSTWTNRTPAVLPASWPSPRAGHVMVYDEARNVMVVFGGTPHTVTSELWEWDGAAGTWTQRIAAGAPGARMWPAMAYEPTRGTEIVIGGETLGSDVGGSMREWNGDAGTWTALSDGGPSMDFGFRMAYDPLRRKMVTYGGTGPPSGADLDKLWEWDPNGWVERTPTPRPAVWPPVRTNYAWVYDPLRGELLMFSGYSSGGTNDFWQFNGDAGTWTELQHGGVQPWPPVRSRFGYALDTHRHKLIVFSGGYFTGMNFTVPDLWEWSSSN